MDYTMVLDDCLAEELCKFKEKGQYDYKIVEKILHYYKSPILLRKKYFTRYYTDSAAKQPFIGASSHINLNADLAQLAKHTLYKVILSKDNNEFPYINIIRDKIENNLTATFFIGEERTKAKNHLKDLFCDANSLFIYDKYLNNNKQCFIEFAKECFPKKPLTIYYSSSVKFSQDICSDLKEFYGKWQLKQDRIYSEYNYAVHDRYIIVDNKIQIILTSGIDNLMDNSKDFTYIIRRL